MGSFSGLLDVLQGALSFAIILPVLIAVHELGHFWIARLLGMDVDAFAVFVGGVRKTKLEHLLQKPLAPSWQLWLLGLASLTTLVIGASMSSVPLTVAGLVVLGFVLPVWIVTRIGALYRLQEWSSIGTLAKTWIAALALYFMGTKLQGAPIQMLGLIALSSLIGILIVYYYPVLHKAEESPSGHGRIEIDENLASKLKPGEEIVESEGDYTRRTRYQTVLFRPLVSRKDKKGTEFSLLCWPLGGFAAIKGMHPKEDGSETQIPGGFYSKPPWARLLVLFAGPLFSVVFGVALLTAQFSIRGEEIPSPKPVVGTVGAEGPAAKAGIKKGDVIKSVNGQPISTFYEAVQIVRQSYKTERGEYTPVPLQIVVSRNGQDVPLSVVPEVSSEPSRILQEDLKFSEKTAIQAKLSMGPTTEFKPLSLGRAASLAASAPVLMVAGLAQTVAKPSEISKNVGGPGMIAQQIQEASKRGIAETIQMAALLSISLGVMNLLPIGPLDGGQMMVAFAEMLRGGRRLSYRIQMTISTIGTLLVVFLVLGVVTLDIGHFGGR